MAADLSQPEGVAQLLQATTGIEVGLLVALAGFGTSGAFLNASLDTQLDMLGVNCVALLTLTNHFSQRFAHRQRGGLILMSSMVAFQGVPFAAHYAATKAYAHPESPGTSVYGAAGRAHQTAGVFAANRSPVG